MKTIVLYESSSGTTKKYAEDIAARVNAEVMPLKKFKWRKLANYDTIVFGGWVLNAQIQGLNDFLSHYEEMEEQKKNVLLFSSGMSYTSPEGRKELIRSNVLDLYHIRYYQLRGSFSYSKLKWKYRMVMSLMIAKVTTDKNSTPEMVAMYKSFKTTAIEYYDQEKVDKIVNVINTLSLQN
ncbi:MAG: flavodoxin domain-containing protein [Bacilli bacterium]|nr:flavodoxin domain-containing protein [Bacilli bacterium]